MYKIIPQSRNIIFLSILMLSTFFSSCEKSENQIRIRINQFNQTTLAAEGPLITLSTQLGNQIGTENWSAFLDQIIGFNYEIGYVYDLLITETEILNQSKSVKTKAYQLKQIVSKTKVEGPITFNLLLKKDLVNFITGTQVSGYKLLNQTPIDCSNLCLSFENVLSSNSKLINGKFILNSNGTIKLIELLID